MSQSILAQEAIKMIRLNDQPIVMGELNGRKAYFLIDTGSDLTILNLKDAKKYKFRIRKIYSRKSRLSSLTSVHKGEFCIAHGTDLYLGSERFEGNYKLFDLSHIIESIAHDSGIRINGIIGSDLMKKHDFIIDYKAKEISFTSQ